MNLRDAVRLVVEDQRASYPEMTEAEAIDHARNTVDPDNIDDPTSELGMAYRAVLD